MTVPFTGENGSYVGYASVGIVGAQAESSKTESVIPAIKIGAVRNIGRILPKIVRE